MEEFYVRLSPKVRKNKKWEAKKIAAEFSNDVHVKCFERPDQVDSLAEIAEQIAKTSYQRGIGVGFFDTLETRAELRQKAESGCLCAHVLYLGGQPVAFWIGDIDHGVFGSGYLGFDPAHGKYSPGTYLILRVIESFCTESPRRVDRVDFGTGAAQYKELLSDDVCNEVEVYVFALSMKGVILNFIKTITTGTDKTLKHALERFGLLQMIKTAWRGRLRYRTARKNARNEA
jgi:CelD/BcsL family acetyltransferase involved in cellulose biosynthesis